MIQCKIKVDDDEKEYDGQYEVNDNYLEVEIFNYSSKMISFIELGTEVERKALRIFDFRNKSFFFSPLFYYTGVTYGLTQYEKYRTDFFFRTMEVEAAEEYDDKMNISAIKIFNPVLGHWMPDPALEVTLSKDNVNYKINNEPVPKVIELHHNNIDQIELNSRCTWYNKNNNHHVEINSECYARLVFEKPISYDETLAYINEFDIMAGAYTVERIHTYETYIETSSGRKYQLFHRLLENTKECKKPIWKPVKMDFDKFLEYAYKNVNYRITENRNEVILLDFKKPTSLEDQYTYYYRFIDLYMGQILKSKSGKEASNFDRLSRFVDDYLSYFSKEDYNDVNMFKNELNSLRNHFVHEGYYFPNGEFEVKAKKQLLYLKKIDYQWLYEIVKVFMLCSYIIFYTKILSVEIDEENLKRILK